MTRGDIVPATTVVALAGSIRQLATDRRSQINRGIFLGALATWRFAFGYSSGLLPDAIIIGYAT
jgi:hypothetical protein